MSLSKRTVGRTPQRFPVSVEVEAIRQVADILEGIGDQGAFAFQAANVAVDGIAQLAYTEKDTLDCVSEYHQQRVSRK